MSSPRRYRLFYSGDDDPLCRFAVIACARCGDELLCDSDTQAERFGAAELAALPCRCNEPKKDPR